jgi:hypothetical protein
MFAMTGSACHESTYWCALQHRTVIRVDDRCDVPDEWICARCGGRALHRASTDPVAMPGGSPGRTPYEFLRMRRTLEDGERLLDDALAQLRRRRGPKRAP